MSTLDLAQVLSRTRAHERSQGMGALWIPLGIYGLARVFSAVVMLWASRYQSATSPVAGPPTETYQVYRSLPADPGYLGVVTNWDGQWYWRIAESGYVPSDVDASAVTGWTWAFPPGYPTVVSALMDLTGAGFPLVASMTSLVLGAVAMVVLFRVVESQAGRLNAVGAVLGTSCFITSPLFQVAYSEALGLLLVLTAVLLMAQRRMWWAVLPVLLLSLTRQVTPPLALVALAVTWVAWRQDRATLSARAWSGCVAVVVASMLGVFLWPLISTLSGGGMGADRVRLTASGTPFGWFGVFFDVSAWAVSVPIAMALTMAWVVVRKHQQWGAALSAWALGYPLFIMVITPPTTGVLRYLLLAFPFAMVLTGGQRWTPRHRYIAMAVGCVGLLALQVLWIRYSFVYEVVDSQTPLMP